METVGHLEQGVCIADADRLLDKAPQVPPRCAEGTKEREQPEGAAELLSQFLFQDIKREPEGTSSKQLATADRVVSVHDPGTRLAWCCQGTRTTAIRDWSW